MHLFNKDPFLTSELRFAHVLCCMNVCYGMKLCDSKKFCEKNFRRGDLKWFANWDRTNAMKSVQLTANDV